MNKLCALLGLLCALLSMGCAQKQTPDASLPNTIALKKVNTFRILESDSLFIGDFVTLTATERPFELYIADFIQNQVVVLDTLGNIRRLIGKPGKGPGELDFPMKALVVDSLLYVKALYTTKITLG